MVANRDTGGDDGNAGPRDFRALKRGGGRLALFAFAAVAAVVVAVAVFVARDGYFGSGVGLDADLCPLVRAEPPARAAFLVDLRKPLGVAAPRPDELLREVTREIGRGTELVVFTLGTTGDMARQRVGRLCKPYAQADLQVEAAKDQRAGTRDCDDPPAQLPANVRDNARRFCERRALLEGTLDELALAAAPEPVEDAYLVEAFEDIKLEFADFPGPRALYVFSDMMQHADWYSHLDLAWGDWRFPAFVEALEARNWVRSAPDTLAGLRVEVFYAPREGRTDQPRVKALHQDFWRRYFDGAAVAYREQPPAKPYAAKRLMANESDAEDAAAIAAAERLSAEQAEVARRQAEIERNQAAVAAAQRELEQERRELERTRESLASAPPRDTPPAEEAPAEEAPVEEPRAEEPPPALPAEPASPPPPEPAPPIEPLLPCEVTPAVANPAPGYPVRFGRWGGRDTPQGRLRNLGDATITVLYGIAAGGATTDVVVLADRSHVTQDRYRSLFEEAAVEAVRAWMFSYDTPVDTCNRGVMRTSTFEFKYAASR